MVLHDLGAAQAPGWLGLVITWVLLAALLLLFLSRRRHLKRAETPNLPYSDEVRAQEHKDAAARRSADQG